MRVNHREELAKQAAEQWKYQYYEPSNKSWGHTVNGSALTTYRKLCAAKKDADKIAAVLDGGGWIEKWCIECHDYKNPTVDFGDSEHTVCLDCLKKAVKLAAHKGETQ